MVVGLCGRMGTGDCVWGSMVLTYSYLLVLTRTYSYLLVFTRTCIRFVSEEVFLSKQFAVFMMLLHLRLLWAFADRKWFLEEGGAWNAVRMFFKEQGGEMGVGGAVAGGAVAGGVKRRRRLELTNERIASMVFASNFLGILCARSLHYQFYSWYFHSIPFILMGSRVPIWCTLPVLAMIEWCWNVFPSTVQSSGVLLGCHLAMLYLAYVHSGWPQSC